MSSLTDAPAFLKLLLDTQRDLAAAQAGPMPEGAALDELLASAEARIARLAELEAVPGTEALFAGVLQLLAGWRDMLMAFQAKDATRVLALADDLRRRSAGLALLSQTLNLPGRLLRFRAQIDRPSGPVQ